MYTHPHSTRVHAPTCVCPRSTGWQRLIGSPKLQIIFHKRATKYRSLLRKMTCKDKGSHESSPPFTLICVHTCTHETHLYAHVLMCNDDTHICIYIYKPHLYTTSVYTCTNCIHMYKCNLENSDVWTYVYRWVLYVHMRIQMELGELRGECMCLLMSFIRGHAYTHVQRELGKLRCVHIRLQMGFIRGFDIKHETWDLQCVDICLLMGFVCGYAYTNATWETPMCGHMSTDGFHTWACVYTWNLEVHPHMYKWN